MPIANCVITSDCTEGSGDLVSLWADKSNVSAQDMTINLLTSAKQIGNQYKVMAHLYLPSIWSAADISALQLGLASALAQYFSVDASDVHVITSVISSGSVVESDVEIHW